MQTTLYRRLGACIAAIYRTTCGTEANPGELDYWFDVGRGGGSLRQIAAAFTNSEAFIPISPEIEQGLRTGAL